VKPEPSEAGADDELDLEDTTTTSSSLELPMFFLQVRKKLLKVLSSHLNWGARLDLFDPLLNSR
jgi:hypothetical protein